MAVSTDRKTPTAEQRRKSMDLAVTVVSAHTDLRFPISATLQAAEAFADYLANGPQPGEADSEESTTD